MSHELDKILIKYDQPDFKKRSIEIRAAVFRATHFNYGSEEDKQLDDILDEVGKREDEAVAEFTEKFDSVKLTPQQFRISKKDLEEAHRQIEAKLLNSIRQAIENVRNYQTDIFIGNFKHPGIKYTAISRVGNLPSYRQTPSATGDT